MRTPFFLCYIAPEICALIRRRVKTEVCEDYLITWGIKSSFFMKVISSAWNTVFSQLLFFNKIKWDQRFVREGIFLNGRHGQLITLEIAPKPDMQIFPNDKTLTLTKQRLISFKNNFSSYSSRVQLKFAVNTIQYVYAQLRGKLLSCARAWRGGESVTAEKVV